MSKLEEAAREVVRILEANGGLKEGDQLPHKVQYYTGLQRMLPLLKDALGFAVLGHECPLCKAGTIVGDG